MALKILPVEVLSAESRALHNAINDEPDFPCVLIATSFLDQCLVSLLERFFVDSRVSTDLLRGALGRLSTRAKLCYALGLIPESLMANLLALSEIRNKFAHSYLSLSFEDAGIMALCESLTFPEVSEWIDVGSEVGEASKPSDPWERFRNPRIKFTIIATSMASRLLLFGLGTERRGAQSKGWC